MPEINVHDEKADKDILMRYETHGNPKDPAIVFVHGWLCNRRFWDDFLVLKDEGYFLIVPDVRGHGDTDYAKDVSVTSIAEDLNSLLDELDIDKVIMIGHSMGGLITQAFYEKYPKKVVALGLWNTGGQIPFGYGIGTAFYIFRISMYLLGLIITYPIGPLFRVVLSQGWKLGFKKLGRSEAYQKHVQSVKNMNRASVLKAAFALPKFKGINKLKDIKVPVSLLHGKADRFITPIQLAKTLDEKITDSDLSILEEAAHFPPNEKPEEVLGLLRVFLLKIRKNRIHKSATS